MQQLHSLVVARFRRVDQVGNLTIQGQAFRVLKDQQKMRCEKENFLLNMLKMSRVLTTEQKIEYFRRSLLIMQVINKEFQYGPLTDVQIDESFLDSYVGLFRKFFTAYEESLQFKTRIQNLLRPTNHNIVTDLLKYLIDFSRDYYQQTFMWQTRQRFLIAQSQPQQQPASQPQILLPTEPPLSKNNSDRLRRLKPLLLPDKQSQKKKVLDLYDILDLQFSVKPLDQGLSLDSIRIRINELFRDYRVRNAMCRFTIERYKEKCIAMKLPTRQYNPSQQGDFPMLLTLAFDKIGHISISVQRQRVFMQHSQSRNMDSKQRPTILSTSSQLSTQNNFLPHPPPPQAHSSESATRSRHPPTVNSNPNSDYLLSSLKILRMSDNFLPPLMRFKDLKTKAEESDLCLTKRASNQVRYYNNEGRVEAERPQLKSLVRNYSPTHEMQMSLQAEDRLIQWLSKIRNVKEIERKKVMGLKDG